MKSFTPMIRQYLSVKEKYPDAILFFRLGDFYEMFFEDAQLAARELEITLTSRDGGNQRVPMCGVPYHAAEGYLARLVSRGHKVAICEQLEDPAAARGLVRRDVVRVITPGTITDDRGLEAKRNNYLVAVAAAPGGYGLAAADVSTGEFLASEFESTGTLYDELARLQPSEYLLGTVLAGDDHFKRFLDRQPPARLNVLEEEAFERKRAYKTLTAHFGVSSLRGFGCEDLHLATSAAGALLSYLQETQKARPAHIDTLRVYRPGSRMLLDCATRRSLELSQRLLDGSRQGTLLWVLDRTLTAMGGRLLRSWVDQPLVDREAIERRLEAVNTLTADPFLRADLSEGLKQVYDLERLAGRAAYGTATPRDLAALRGSLAVLPRLQGVLTSGRTAPPAPLLHELAERIDPLEDLANLLRNALVDEPPATAADGSVIRPGFNEEVDQLRRLSQDCKSWLASLEASEREKTGIKSLKVGYNRVFGYYIEITRANQDLVPAEYTRKQTLANSERYITPELKELEERILGAEDRLLALEQFLFNEVRESVAAESIRIRATAGALAELDALLSLAETALANNYVKPVLTSGKELVIRDGRHPVVELIRKDEPFVPNDTYMDGEDFRILIITGPNMAGKSTYLRQVALIVLMAQIGSFVPAREATIGLADRIFARVGASDDLAGGQSTFMVEMTEVANILNNATSRSLLILDEIGRGTSTFDGLSIAWAVSEYIHDHPEMSCRTLFATHYHELTELEQLLPGAKNFSVAVQESGEQVLFLYRIVRGGSDKSYGIHVARLAGLPPAVTRRAVEILGNLERQALALGDVKDYAGSGECAESGDGEEPGTPAGPVGAASLDRKHRRRAVQLALIRPEPHPVLEQLKSLNIMNMTPLEALKELHQLQQKAIKE